MGHPASHLADRGQPLDLLLPPAELGLIGQFDNRQVQIEQLVERTQNGGQLGAVDRRVGFSVAVMPVRNRDNAALV